MICHISDMEMHVLVDFLLLPEFLIAPRESILSVPYVTPSSLASEFPLRLLQQLTGELGWGSARS